MFDLYRFDLKNRRRFLVLIEPNIKRLHITTTPTKINGKNREIILSMTLKFTIRQSKHAMAKRHPEERIVFRIFVSFMIIIFSALDVLLSQLVFDIVDIVSYCLFVFDATYQ